jgi:hypothetical protein
MGAREGDRETALGGRKTVGKPKKDVKSNEQTQYLIENNGPANFGVKNGLKTNSFFHAKAARPMRKCSPLAQTPGNSKKACAGTRVEGGQSQSPLCQTQY